MQKVCKDVYCRENGAQLGLGYKVGRVDQAETALGAEMRVAADKGKNKKMSAADKGADKIVRRELNKVYTNGTLVDEALLTDEQAGHCVSLREEGEEDPKTGKQKFGLCVLDSSTSEFNLSAFEDDVCRTKLETMMRQLRPKEHIFTKVRPHLLVLLGAFNIIRVIRVIYPCLQLAFSRLSFHLSVCGRA